MAVGSAPMQKSVMTMADREKVIKELSELHGSKETMEIIEQAIAPLKEQEALPIDYQTNLYTGLPVARCPSCGESLLQFHAEAYGKETKYCYYCGQAVKWNEFQL